MIFQTFSEIFTITLGLAWHALLLFSCQVVLDSFVTPWAVARQASLSMGFPMARILEWVARSSSRGSS